MIGEWPDDPMLLLPYMALAYGVVGGALAVLIGFAPVVLLARRVSAGRPWFEAPALAATASLGAYLFLVATLGPFLLDYVPALAGIAMLISAVGGCFAALIYWLLRDRPR